MFLSLARTLIIRFFRVRLAFFQGGEDDGDAKQGLLGYMAVSRRIPLLFMLVQAICTSEVRLREAIRAIKSIGSFFLRHARQVERVPMQNVSKVILTGFLF